MHLFEQLFILALDEDEGYIVESAVENLESALAGTVFAELVLQQRIELNGVRVVVKNLLPTSHPVLDQALFDIVEADRVRKLSFWINILTHKKLLYEIGQDLVDQGVLAQQKKRLRLASATGQDQVIMPSIKYNLKNQLREVVLAGRQPGLRETVLLAFLYQADLLRLVFTVGERKAASRRIKGLVASEDEESRLNEIMNQIIKEACN